MTTRRNVRSRSRTAEPSATKYLTMAQLCARYGDCSSMTIERRLKHDPRFPQPMPFGSKRMRLWKESDCEKYERALVVAKEKEKEDDAA